MNPAPRVLTIAAEVPFLRVLAGWVFAEHGKNMADVQVFLPNRRACRSFRETLLDATGGKPMLLPRIQPVGDMEHDDLPTIALSGNDIADLPAAIAPERRLLLLTRLVMQFEKTRSMMLRGRQAHAAQAAQLARQLARFMDDIAREGIDASTLSQLAPAELAQHWQQTLDFLKIITVHWPEVLKGEGVVDPIEYRNRVLHAVAQAWQKHPPAMPVIAAGSTGTQPATAALLARIARLPQGCVILPGLDLEMPEKEWEILSPAHPQYALKTLLKCLDLPRHDVLPLRHEETPAIRERMRCLRTVFQPAEATAQWAQARLPLERGLQGVRLLVADTVMDEARMIGAALRKALETPEKTAALVTPDRELARLVAAQMQRFGVAIDDSAGVKLLDTPAGHFLSLVADLAASGAAPVSLLSVLRHPLAAAGREPAECRDLSRILDKKYLRGVRRVSGLTALREAIGEEHRPLKLLLGDLEQRLRRFSAWMKKRAPVAPSELLAEQLQLAEWLASTPEEPGAGRLWSGDDGNALAETLARMREHIDVLPAIDPASYGSFLDALLAEVTYRPRYGQHPRLHILSPLEARLQRYDLVILGGLSEGVWPAPPAVDPWMSRPMREAFGLPPMEHSIGQSAHDFFGLCAAPELLLTRPRKVAGAPAVPSRWLVRMTTLLKGKDASLLERIGDTHDYEEALARLDAPVAAPKLPRPEPRPPSQARLKKIKATAVDHWQADPYQVYAEHILGLKALRPLDQEPGAADLGSLVHEAVKHFADRWDGSPENALETLLASGRSVFKPYLSQPVVMSLWWPRFEAMAGWFVEQERVRRTGSVAILTERDGTWPLAVDGELFTFTTRIDRLEMDARGAVVVDYKTGAVPSTNDMRKGLASQLPIEGLVVREGVLDPPLPRNVNVTGLEYWRLGGSAENCAVTPFGTPEEVAALLQQCRERLMELVRRYRDPAEPFAAVAYLKARHNDYEHLTRRQEWVEA